MKEKKGLLLTLVKLLLPLALVGLLFATSIGYNLFQTNKLTNLEKSEALNSQILKNEINQKEIIRKKYDSIINDYKQYRARIEDRNNLLSNKENVIKLKNQDVLEILNQESLTPKEINRAKKMIANLESSIQNYKTEVSQLLEENEILVHNIVDLNNKNADLDNKNADLETDIDYLKKRNKILARNYETEKYVRAKDNEKNKIKIENLISTLSISNQKIKGIKVKRSGREVENTRARRINKIRVSFDVDKNSKIKSGSKKLYVAIYNPDGSLGKFKNSKGGTIILRSGEKVNYSDAITFQYSNKKSKNIVFDWNNKEFKKGAYTINVYENGFKISQAKINLD